MLGTGKSEGRGFDGQDGVIAGEPGLSQFCQLVLLA